MTIETAFNIGDTVTHKGREGLVVQIRVDVQQTAETPFIVYKVFFGGVAETRRESELNAAD